MPSQILSSYFQDVSFVNLLYAVGIIPLMLGVYAIYSVVFETKNRTVQLYIGLAMSSFILMWLKLIPPSTGLLFFSTSMIILSAYTMKTASAASAKMKVASTQRILAVALVVLFVATTIPAFFAVPLEEPQQQGDVNALLWLKENAPNGSIVLGKIDEGFIISYYSGLPSVSDQNFLFVKNPEQNYQEVQDVFSSRLASEAIRILDKKSVNYIFLSKKTKQHDGITRLFYADDACFEVVYDNDATIYEFKDVSCNHSCIHSNCTIFNNHPARIKRQTSLP
jgi:uncharacterized membrane protein